MRIRPILAMFLVAGLALPVSAQATHLKPAKPKPKPVCLLIIDASGDATGTGTAYAQTPSSDDGLDIISADIATNTTTLTTTIRLKKLTIDDLAAPTGRGFHFTFSVGQQSTTLAAFVSPAGTSWYDGKGTGVVDTAGSQIRMSVPLSDLPVKVTPGTVLTGLSATTSRWVDSAIIIAQADKATSTRTYTASAPSCLAVGS